MKSPRSQPAAAAAGAAHTAGPGAIAAPAIAAPRQARVRAGSRVAWLLRPRPELIGLLILAGLLDLWALSRNGWANEYYSAAVRSMSSSWHNFLYASADPSGVMTVDKPPLSLWVQALSARVFGFHPLSILVPEALMGVASVALIYDLTRRRFGRLAGFIAGLVLALTPMTVAVSRHNNPDALLVLCCVAAMWFAVRAFEDGRTRWLLLSGASIGLGFETKMGVALMVLPAIAAAWLWVAPRGRRTAMRQLLGFGATTLAVGGAWPLMVALTPSSSRPWISGTSDNSILSLILNYNGVGRLDGQSGGPQAFGGAGPFGGSSGPLRLLNASLGGQAGWLLGFAVVALAALAVTTRLRRGDVRTGWLIAVGGSFATIAVVFSAARGIFHPYYVSQLAPFTAALVGAGAGLLRASDTRARILSVAALAAGVAVELAVLHDYPGNLTWLAPVLVGVGVACAIGLAIVRAPRLRSAILGVALGALLIGPAIWSVDTLGHATSGTFPAGGPVSASADGPGGVGGPGGFARRASGGGFAGGPRPAGAIGPSGAIPQGAPSGGPPLFGSGGAAQGAPQGASAGVGGGFAGGGFGGPFGGDRSLTQILAYVRSHGGGTIAVSSQSAAASSILSSNAQVAGIGGFSGRESDVSTSWLASEVRSGNVRWVLADSGGFAGPGSDGRTGARSAMAAVARACRQVPSSAYATTSSTGASFGAATGGLYDCAGRASALATA